MQKEYFSGEAIGTIYFGGGTPSLLKPEEISELIGSIHDHFTIEEGAEITLEANPDDITTEKLQSWKNSGINRLSVGIQSFFDEDLRWMNRAHTAKQAIENTEQALIAFENISIDLIYGTPGLSHERWEKNMQLAVSMGIPHLSCYAMTVEPKTPLFKMIREQQTEATDPDHQAEQFTQCMEFLEAAGYEHYEISNYAKPGRHSRHNTSYWQGKKYLGLGPSAHSFNGQSRQWNVSNNNLYMRALEKGTLPAEKEILTAVQQLNENIMISLRTAEGLNLKSMEPEKTEALLRKSEPYINSGLLLHEQDRLRLSKEGKLLADGIASVLFF